MTYPTLLPVIPLKDIVVFPDTIVPIFVGREKSIVALEESQKIGDGDHIILVSQKDSDRDNIRIVDLYKVGVLAKIRQTIKLSDNTYKIVVEGIEKIKLTKVTNDKCFMSKHKILSEENTQSKHLDSKLLDLMAKFASYIKINKRISQELKNLIKPSMNTPAVIVNVISSHLTCSLKTRQEILEISNLEMRLNYLIEVIDIEIQTINTDLSIQREVKKQIEKTQRDYYLNEQVKAIQKELGNGDDKEFEEIEKKIKSVKLSKEAKEKAESELKKYKSLNSATGESGVIRTYLDVLLSLPWGKKAKTQLEIKEAARILNRDHYGLHKVKERILEYLAVLKRSNKVRGPILCLVGPPGVGKTSLIKSIADSIGRPYAKFALGGVRDESEIRGHRKTYIGSMPGKILTILKKVKCDNPVILLDEIDKLGKDFRGDPASALLEVLDPEQNSKFSDHYLELEYDLSNVMFIATANSLDIPRALRDRLEIINVSGYIENEKFQILKNYILPKQLKFHELKESEISIDDESLYEIIRYYTKESGVRELERKIASIARKSLTKILDENIETVSITTENIKNFLGIRKYKIGLSEEDDTIGATTGLAYTEVGGELLTIEAVVLPGGKGEIKSTGKLGDVMKESTEAAFSFARSKISDFGLKVTDYNKHTIHLHVPEGAIPKDGPSAGIAIFTTIVSLLSGIPVKKTVAMTGEITLRGKVLAIGGLREKLLAASRGGIKTVIIPQENEPDLIDIPNSIIEKLEIIPVNSAEQVLYIALTKNIVTNFDKKFEIPHISSVKGTGDLLCNYSIY